MYKYYQASRKEKTMLVDNRGAFYVNAPRTITLPIQKGKSVTVKKSSNGVGDIVFSTNKLRENVQAEFAGPYTEPINSELMYKYVTEALWDFPEAEGVDAETFCSRERDLVCAAAFKSPNIYQVKCVDLQDIFAISAWWRRYCPDYWVNDQYNYNMTYWEGENNYHEHFVRDGKLMMLPSDEELKTERIHTYKLRATVIIKASELAKVRLQ